MKGGKSTTKKGGGQVKPEKLKVIELFAGVGGFRLGLEGWQGKAPCSNYRFPLRAPNEGGYEVVWSNQWEPSTKRQHANEVYENRWPDAGHCGDDIGTVATKDIPDHDMLVGGFPCQDYSVATTLKNSKGLKGKKGVLWWEIERIISEKGRKAPRYVFLENVDRLLKSPASRRGQDFAIILASLAPQLRRRVARHQRRRLRHAPTPPPRLHHGLPQGHPGIRAPQEAEGQRRLARTGVIGEAFPINPVPTGPWTRENSWGFGRHQQGLQHGKKEGAVAVCHRRCDDLRVFWTAKADPAYDDVRMTLGDVLQPLKDVPKEFRVDKADLEMWQYFKGAKRIPKVNKTLGYEWVFSEGAMGKTRFASAKPAC